MQIIAAVGGLSFVLASLVVGLRLMYLGWRNKGLAEWVLGAGLFFMGGVGYPLTIVAHDATSMDMRLRIALLAAYVVFNTLGMTGVAWFTRRVFRPHARWSLIPVVATLLVYVVPGIVQTAGPGWAEFARSGDGPWLYSQLGVGAMTWAGIESFLYWGQMRRRMKLGLADPVLSDRFRLWGISMLVASGITLVSHLLNTMGIQTVGTAIGAIVVGPPGMLITVCLWLAFFPPQAYARWLNARSPVPDAASGI